MSTFKPKHVFPRGEVIRVTITDGVGVTEDTAVSVVKIYPPPTVVNIRVEDLSDNAKLLWMEDDQDGGGVIFIATPLKAAVEIARELRKKYLNDE